jgi:tetratricopeptide (TPR) repeat protein
MNQEQLFYRDLYLYLSNSSFQSLKPWQKWEHLTSKPLNDVLVMFYAVRTNQMTKENVAQKFSLLSHDDDGFAKALFGALFTSDYSDLINFVNDVKTIRDGFCWLFLTTLLKEQQHQENALKKLYECAIKTPFGYAKTCYGIHLRNQEKWKQAYQMFKKAARKHNDCAAWHQLGDCFASGSGVKKNDYRAVYCYKKAAKMGSKSCIQNVGFFYSNSRGGRKSLTKAVKWYSKLPDLVNHVEKLKRQMSEIHALNQYLCAMKNYYDCDCFQCRTVLYEKIPLYKRRDNTSWFARWDKCKERCFLVILCFRHAFGAKGVGKIVARHLWATRADDCWKRRRLRKIKISKTK